ncbi:hypothetical protein M5K25_017663 [Dendrobium thyrsiflorum]|uniref:DUF936 domain-containing protein n=1 Tax=Dendrobium thyrsiflorum TaxID=117978 RepID=A0ABD0UND4_DENTH
MATLNPGVLLKLLQSMNSDSKPFSEHRSAVLQVTGIVPTPSDSHGFHLQLSDSLNSTYVSLSDQDADIIVSNRPQLVHVDRLQFDFPVPRDLGLRPISAQLLLLPLPQSSRAQSLLQEKNVIHAASKIFSSGTTSSVSKPRRSFSSLASWNPSLVREKKGSSVGSRALSPVPSKCEVPILVAAREENRKVAREPAIVVPSRYRQPSPVVRKTVVASPIRRKGVASPIGRKGVASPIGRKGVASPGGRKLSGGMKFSPAAGDGGGKRKVWRLVAGITKVSNALMMSRRSVRKSCDGNSLSSENSFGNAGSKSKVHEKAPRKAQVIEILHESDSFQDKDNFQMQEVAGERGGYLHGRGALDSDDLLYLKEQMEAEEDAERLLRRTEKRAFAAFKISASLADSTPPSLPLPLRVEPKTKSGIRQQDLLKKIVEVKPKKPRVSTLSEQTKISLSSPVLATPAEHCTGELPSTSKATVGLPKYLQTSSFTEKITINDSLVTRPIAEVIDSNMENPVKSLLGITYDSSDED